MAAPSPSYTGISIESALARWYNKRDRKWRFAPAFIESAAVICVSLRENAHDIINAIGNGASRPRLLNKREQTKEELRFA
jgi:hypothetical protein